MNSSTQVVPSALSLRANFSWTFIGNAVYAGCQWGMLVALAKLGSPEMVGQFALSLAITAPVMAFTSLRMRLVQATDARHEYSFGDYLGLRLLTTVLGLLAILGIAVISGYHHQTVLVILAVGTAKAIESISDVFYGLVQLYDRMDRIAKSLFLRGPISLIALSVGVYLTGDLLYGVLGLVVIWTLVLLFYDIRSGASILEQVHQTADRNIDQAKPRIALHPRWDSQTLARLTWATLPLGFVMMLSSLHTSIPRYFIEQYVGASGLGVFAALAYFDRAGSFVVSSLGQAVSPRLARYHAAGDGRAFRRLLIKLAGVGVVLGVMGVLVAVFAGREILTLLYQPEYADKDLFVLLMISAALAYLQSLLIYSVSAARYFRVQLVLYAAVTTTLVLACHFLVPVHGLYGAATAMILAKGTLAAGGLAIAYQVLAAFKKATDHELTQDLQMAQIELFGCTRAGKSTIARRVLGACREHGIPAVMSEEFVLRQVRLSWIKVQLVRTLLMDLICFSACLASLPTDHDFCLFAIRVILQLRIAWLMKLNLARNMIKRIGVYAIVSRRGSGQEVVLVDGGTLQAAHHLFVHVPGSTEAKDVLTFVRLAPMPSAAIYLTQTESVLIERTLIRGHKRIPDGSYTNVESFIKQAVSIFDELALQLVAERGLLMSKNGQNVFVTQRHQDDPLLNAALEIACTEMGLAVASASIPPQAKISTRDRRRVHSGSLSEG